jgi:hypothetical protein
MHEARILHLVPGLVVGEVGPVCATIWRDEVDPARFEQQLAGVAHIAARFPKRAAFVCIVEPTCEPPNQEMRERSRAMLETHAKDLACVAAVIEGSGFRASIARSVLSGITRLSRSATPQHFCAHVTEAGPWVGQHVAIDARSFVETVEVWRNSLPAPRTPL